MTEANVRATGPIRLGGTAGTTLRPATGAAITGGLWAERRRVNREISIPGAWDRLHEAGNFHNLELAAGRASGEYVNELPFLDSDVYKWLEAVGWVLADPDLAPERAAGLRSQLDETEKLLRAAPQPDGYLDSHFQVRFPGERFVQLPWGHELYCAGHLVQAAVAVHRTTGDDGLLRIARRVADLVVESFGPEPGRVDGVCGHPEIETALVELYRETGEPSYLARARYFIDRRGHGLLGDARFGPQYWQDHQPIREAPSVEGHAVRQLYLLAGVADVHLEDGDPSLLDAATRLWTEMVATKVYLTGGIGAHHKDEAFGDPYELPNERSYCETCAAISSIMFCWRMLIITAEAKYADLLERTLYNGFLAGLSLDGQHYIYANPLQVREGHVTSGTDGDYARVPWFSCACCPPNVMRTLASLEHYVLLGGDRRAALHQYIPGRYTAEVGDAPVTLEVETDYPWSGAISIRVVSTPTHPWALAVRIPDWVGGASLIVDGVPAQTAPQEGWWVVDRQWSSGDQIELTLPMEPRFTRADPRLDVARGSVALEYGPLVYCFEAADNTEHRLDDVAVDVTAPLETAPADPALGMVTEIRATGRARTHRPDAWWPYRPVDEAYPEPDSPVRLTAVPYYTWGNRGVGAMRIWVPTT